MTMGFDKFGVAIGPNILLQADRSSNCQVFSHDLVLLGMTLTVFAASSRPNLSRWLSVQRCSSKICMHSSLPFNAYSRIGNLPWLCTPRRWCDWCILVVLLLFTICSKDLDHGWYYQRPHRCARCSIHQGRRNRIRDGSLVSMRRQWHAKHQ